MSGIRKPALFGIPTNVAYIGGALSSLSFAYNVLSLGVVTH